MPPRLIEAAATRFDELIHDTTEKALDLEGQLPMDSVEWSIVNLRLKNGGFGLTRTMSIRHAAYFASELRMMHEDVLKYTVNIAPVYGNLELPDADESAGHVVRKDFKKSWQWLIENLSTRFFKLLVSDYDDLPGDEKSCLRSLICLYPKNTPGKGNRFSPKGYFANHAKWQREISHAIHDRDLTAIVTSTDRAKVSDRLLSVLQHSRGQGGSDMFTSIPVGKGPKGLEYDNGTFHAQVCLRLDLENLAYHVPAGRDGRARLCCLRSKHSNKLCGKTISDEHLRSCRSSLNCTNERHDQMLRSFWGPLLGSLLGGIEYEKRWLARRTRAAVAAARKAGIEPKKATQQRPGDIWWAYHLTLKLRGMDYNVSTALPYSGEQQHKNDRRPLCCRDARGVNRVRNEQTKLTKLSKVGNLSDGASAVKVITPVCFSTTGAGAKLAIKFFRQLAAVAHPGDDKDPGVRHARAVWALHQRKVHSAMLAKTIHDLCLRKRKQILEKFHVPGVDPSNKPQQSIPSGIDAPFGFPDIGAPLSSSTDPQFDLGVGVDLDDGQSSLLWGFRQSH